MSLAVMTMLSAPRQADSNGAGGLEGLWDNEDDSLKIPDFHFDWGVAKDKTTTEMGLDIESALGALNITQTAVKASRNIRLSTSTSTKTGTTPPLQTHSAQSSISSVHVMSITDTSSATASSLFPSPSNPSIPMNSRSLSSHGSESGGSDNGRQGRTYGQRNFQRIASAPLTRQTYAGPDASAVLEDISV